MTTMKKPNNLSDDDNKHKHMSHDNNTHDHINATERSIPETVILRAKFLLLQHKPDRMVPILKLFAQF